jgi:hypothetical protein
MYHDRTAWRCEFFVGKNMEAKDIHKEMLPIWAAFPSCPKSTQTEVNIAAVADLVKNDHRIMSRMIADL